MLYYHLRLRQKGELNSFVELFRKIEFPFPPPLHTSVFITFWDEGDTEEVQDSSFIIAHVSGFVDTFTVTDPGDDYPSGLLVALCERADYGDYPLADYPSVFEVEDVHKAVEVLKRKGWGVLP